MLICKEKNCDDAEISEMLPISFTIAPTSRCLYCVIILYYKKSTYMHI